MARRASVAVIVCAVALALYAQIHTVSRVAIVVNPRTYNGPCPAALKFTATIFVNVRPAHVTYQWERSDGAQAQRQSVEINAAGRGVSETWTLGAPGQRLRVWEQLHVVAPTGIKSPRAYATVNCRR